MKKRSRKHHLATFELDHFLSSDDDNWQSIMGKVIKKNNKGKQSF